MATRSTIAVIHNDGRVSQVYCHWDGYLEGVGRTLIEHYNSLELAEELMTLGDLSVLGTEIGRQHDFDALSKDIGDVCTAYGRDRGETGTEARVFATVKEYLGNCQSEEYDYLFQTGEWFYVSHEQENFALVGRSLKQLEKE